MMVLAVSNPLTLRERYAGLLYGALAADSLALAPHWIYEQDEIVRRFGRVSDLQAAAEGYHAGKERGAQTHYGDQTLVLMLSMHDETLYADRALRAGARGYIMKRETAKKIILAIRQMLGGKIYMSDSLSASFAEKFVDGQLLTSGSLVDQLTDRELEVFQLLGKGCETRQVAQMMTLSMKTVQTHCAHIKEKLKLTNAAELLREAVRWQESNPTG